MSRYASVADADSEASIRPSAEGRRRPGRRAQTEQRDVVAVGVLTPALIVGILVGVLVLGQTFYPDTYVEPTVEPAATRAARADAATPVPVARPIDMARLNAGVVDKAPAFEWPEVPDLKLQPDPGRPNEHADYVPALADVNARRLIAALSVNIVLHSSSSFAQGAVEELAKPYPLRATTQKVLDLTAQTGYVPDDSVFAVVFGYGPYRIQIEAVPTAPPVKQAQRADVEYQALHLADHIARHMQEIASGGTRTGPEAMAVHWRDHVARSLPFGR